MGAMNSNEPKAGLVQAQPVDAMMAVGPGEAMTIVTLIEPEAAAEEDRRRSRRFRTVFRLARVIRDRTVGLWRVRNISDFGMMLQTRTRVTEGDRLSVALSEGHAIEARVIWCRDDSCGVEFDHPIDSDELLRSLASRPGGTHEQRAQRLDVDLKAASWCERGVQPIRVRNLSQQGLGFAHEGWARAGMQLLVQFGNGIERRGVVRWSDGSFAGLRLLDPLRCEELESLAQTGE